MNAIVKKTEVEKAGWDLENSKSFQDMSWEELLLLREKFLAEQENIEAAISVVREEIILKLDRDGTPDGRIVGEKSISVRTTYTTDKDTAKELGAIKTFTTERIDTGLIKAMYLKGAKIPNLQINKIPQILDVVKKQKETENS